MTPANAPEGVSSCEVPETEPRPARRLLRFDPATFTWEGVPAQAYKPARDASLTWEGVARHVLVGAAGEPAAFHLRYFEIAPGGFSSLERHTHTHAVIVLRGRGSVRVGTEVYEVRPFDLVYVPPDEPHQFVNIDPHAPFGFLCPVDAQRDPPRPPEDG